MKQYTVTVGNLGTVYSGSSLKDADIHFRTYRDDSKAGNGRVAGEPVTLLCDGEPKREYTPKVKLPPMGEIRAQLIALKSTIQDDYRASEFPDEDDTTPSMAVTIGADRNGKWNYQTGDNSFTGGAYGLPYWAVLTLTRKSNCTELAREAIDEIAELAHQDC